jgi:hypothetical protein
MTENSTSGFEFFKDTIEDAANSWLSIAFADVKVSDVYARVIQANTRRDSDNPLTLLMAELYRLEFDRRSLDAFGKYQRLLDSFSADIGAEKCFNREVDTLIALMAIHLYYRVSVRK